MVVDYKMMGKRMKARRKELKLTQKDLTEKVGLNDKYISNIERATSIPSIDTLVGICTVLDISIDFLLEGVINNPPEMAVVQKIINILRLMDSKDQEFVLNFLEIYTLRTKE